MKTDRFARWGCTCALWCEGTIEGKYFRRALITRSWERASQIVRSIENGEKAALADAEPEVPNLSEATKNFMADAEHGRKLSQATLTKISGAIGTA